VLWILRDILLLVVTAVVIASALEPGVVFFKRHRIPRILSVMCMYVLVFGSVFSIVYFFVPPIIDDVQNFVATVPQYLDTVNLPWEGVKGSTTALFSPAGDAQSFFDSLLQFRDVFTGTSGGFFRIFSVFFGGIFSFLLVIILSFYFTLQETSVEDFLRVVTPAKQEEYAVDLWRRAQKKIGLWMQGQIILSIIIGVLIYLGLLIAGVPYALLLAVITAVTGLIPVFGSIAAGVLAVSVAFTHDGFTLALITGGLYIIVNQFEANLIYPLVVKKVVGLPPILVILALIAGGALAGFLGILLSVPVAAALQEMVTDFEKGKRREHSS
jgi:predicted PurR-regulated permease PerM